MARPVENNGIQQNVLPEGSSKNIWKSRFISLVQKVILVAKFALVVAATIVFYPANPSLFFLGLFAGLIFDKKVRAVADKVEKICIAHPWVIPLIGISAFLALPVVMGAGSFSCGAYISSKIAGMVPEDYDPRSRIPKFIRSWMDN